MTLGVKANHKQLVPIMPTELSELVEPQSRHHHLILCGLCYLLNRTSQLGISVKEALLQSWLLEFHGLHVKCSQLSSGVTFSSNVGVPKWEV